MCGAQAVDTHTTTREGPRPNTIKPARLPHVRKRHRHNARRAFLRCARPCHPVQTRVRPARAGLRRRQGPIRAAHNQRGNARDGLAHVARHVGTFLPGLRGAIGSRSNDRALTSGPLWATMRRRPFGVVPSVNQLAAGLAPAAFILVRQRRHVSKDVE